MSDSADLLQQLMDIRRKVANVSAKKLSGGKQKRKSPKRKSPKRKSPKRKSPKRKSPKRKSPKRKSPKRKSPKRKLGGSQAKTTAGIRRAVWEGRLRSTKGGLKKKDLKVNKTGKIVSKKASNAAKKRLRENPRLAMKFKQQQNLMRGTIGAREKALHAVRSMDPTARRELLGSIERMRQDKK